MNKNAGTRTPEPVLSIDDYEKVPYQSAAHQLATPEAAAVAAHLVGVCTPDVRTARVLEIGCAGGGNLIPLAQRYPDATFVGIDPAEVHVRQGQQTVFALGLENVVIQRRDLRDIGDDDGVFDYIIAHGVYSWVPAETAQQLLQLIVDRLSPEGVAYVSYNTLPGWNVRRLARDAMRFHVEPFDEPKVRVAQAKAMLEVMASASPDNSPVGIALKRELSIFQEHGDFYLFHDHLADDNEPLFFREFVQRVRSVGLDYLAESDLSVMVPQLDPERIEPVLEQISDEFIRTQQYLDFFESRAFRGSLLVHTGRPVDRVIGWQRVADLCATTTVGLSATLPLPLEATTLRGRRQRELETDNPLVIAAWSEMLAAFPASLPVRALADRAVARLRDEGITPPSDPLCTLCKNILYASTHGLAELHILPLVAGTGEETHPMAFGMARLQALARSRAITSLRHESQIIDPFHSRLLSLCDGTRTLADLAEILADDVAERRLRMVTAGEEQSIEAAVDGIDQITHAKLLQLGRMGALLAPGPDA